MKKSVILTFTLIIAFSFYTRASNNLISNGHSLKLNFGFPSESYGYPDGSKAIDYVIILGIQTGNQWYLYKNNHFGVGLNINWADLSYTRKKKEMQYSPIIDEISYESEFLFYTFDFSFAEIGPIATVAIGEHFAFDAYYNLRPTSLISLTFDENKNGNVSYKLFGLTNSIGGGFRYSKLFLGFDYVFGTLKNATVNYAGDFSNHSNDKMDMKTNNLRLTLGLKF